MRRMMYLTFCLSSVVNSIAVRTPLNAIIGMLDMTLNTELGDKQREYLTSVQFAADSLLRIVNDVLDIRYCARSQNPEIYNHFVSDTRINFSVLPLEKRPFFKSDSDVDDYERK